MQEKIDKNEKFKNSDIRKVLNIINNDDVINFQNNKDNIILFNIESTTRCNNNCSYCHVFASKYNRIEWKDIDTDLFIKYMHFIKHFSEKSNWMIQWRFSWGDPIVLGDRLFELANLWFEITWIKPYVLTAWRWINDDWISKARDSALSHAFISVENPFDQDPWANKTENVIDAISKYNDERFKLKLWVCIIKNKWFWQIFDICSYFVDKIKQIPTLHELNYSMYKKPTDKEFLVLKDQLKLVLDKYGDLYHLKLMPSAFPELSYWWKMVYLWDLTIWDKFWFLDSKMDLDEYVDFFARRFISFSYPKHECKNKCELSDFCNNMKWFWKYDEKWNFCKDRLEGYCRMKKILSDLYISKYN